jgi:hypothetical protein
MSTNRKPVKAEIKAICFSFGKLQSVFHKAQLFSDKYSHVSSSFINSAPSARLYSIILFL